MTKIKSYTQATEELEDILLSLEQQEDVNMDVISDKVKRATELITFCKNRLRQLDEELEHVIKPDNGRIVD